MGSKVKVLSARSFADALGGGFRETVQAAHVEKNFLKWDAQGRALEAIGAATETLNTWLTARFTELVSEKVPMEEVKVRFHGTRTVVYVRSVPRFEFKIKCTMEMV